MKLQFGMTPDRPIKHVVTPVGVHHIEQIVVKVGGQGDLQPDSGLSSYFWEKSMDILNCNQDQSKERLVSIDNEISELNSQ